ncbi:hypothetical protein POTOM_056491 [Populus tomentosa]|uniref:Actin-related protein 6 n=1 Tax=Populus tomentosa TaxID=118781 RepID=A0A8X8C4L7_POPTO|nr:hypothetical protein POTOM_056491 [Populus tomentosa]
MSSVVVLDNGGGLIKAGYGGERDPSTIIPNCLYRPLSSKKFLHPTPTTEEDLTSAAVRRPIDRGYLINPDLQRDIWNHLFSNLLHINPSNSSLLLTEPLFSLPSIERATDELVFEDFGFNSLFISDPPKLVHLYEASRRPYGLVSKAQCSLVVDCGFSFTHAAPVFQNFTLNYGVKRIDLGGKALTNFLKELVSYRSVSVMDESFIMDDVKEKLCFVSLDVARDLKIARWVFVCVSGCCLAYNVMIMERHEKDDFRVSYWLRMLAKSGSCYLDSLEFLFQQNDDSLGFRRRGNDNFFRCTYVLPDGVTHTKGFVKDPDEAKKYLTVDDGAYLETRKDMDRTEIMDRKKVDLTKNEFDLTNERFLVPEMIFHPADLGMNQAGLAECIVRAVNSCHPLLHPLLYQSIILTGGSTLFPRFAERLEMELRPLVPDDYQVKITTQEDPILGVWRGGSLLASSPDFEAMCVTKAEYEELGSARCRRRFFH